MDQCRTRRARAPGVVRLGPSIESLLGAIGAIWREEYGSRTCPRPMTCCQSQYSAPSREEGPGGGAWVHRIHWGRSGVGCRGAIANAVICGQLSVQRPTLTRNAPCLLGLQGASPQANGVYPPSNAPYMQVQRLYHDAHGLFVSCSDTSILVIQGLIKRSCHALPMRRRGTSGGSCFSECRNFCPGNLIHLAPCLKCT